MAVYNEIVAVTAGAGLLGVAAFLWLYIDGKRHRLPVVTGRRPALNR